MISLDNDVKLNFTIFKNQYTVEPIKQATTMYSEFLTALQTPKIGRKNSNHSFVGGVVLPVRKNDNVRSRSMLTLDFDDIPADIEHLFDHLQHTFQFAFAMYSTHNHSEDNHRFRVIVPFSHEIKLTPRKYKRLVQHVTNDMMNAPFVDESSEVISQVMHFPTCNSPRHYFFDYVDEELFNPSLLIEELPDDDEVEITTTDEWLDILNGISEGGRNVACAKLTGHLLGKHVHPNIVYELIRCWNERNAPALSDKELNRTFESIFKKVVRERYTYEMPDELANREG